MKIIYLEFEVFGHVQGVHFRYYTQQKAQSLNILGWIRNTDKGTVEGELEGTDEAIDTMKTWLETEGSPKSKIDYAVFKNEQEIKQHSFSHFLIKLGDM